MHTSSTFKLKKALKSLLVIYSSCAGHSDQKKVTGIFTKKNHDNSWVQITHSLIVKNEIDTNG